VKKKNEETWHRSHLVDQELHQLLKKVDADLALLAAFSFSVKAKKKSCDTTFLVDRVKALGCHDALDLS
jgi:hypothetical protein